MDTVEITIRDPEAAARVVPAIRAKGASVPPRRDKFSKKIQDQDGELLRPNPRFRSRRAAKLDGRFFYAQWDSTDENGPDLVMQFHLSHFDNFQHFSQWLRALSGDSYEVLTSAQITRLDTCMDLALPITFMRDQLQQLRARNSGWIRKGLESLYFGSKPHQTCIYEKMIPWSTVDYIPANHLPREPTAVVKCVRVEVRHTKRKTMPARTLTELPELRLQNPFAHMRLEGVQSNSPESYSLLIPKRSQIQVWAYERLVMTHGAQRAKQILNKQGNFARNVGRYLTRVAPECLELAWKLRCERFFDTSLSKRAS